MVGTTFFVLYGILGKSSLGALLRERKVTGRDASLPAPLQAASLGLVGRGTVGALPQTPAGTLSLHPARGKRKGTKSPLDPFLQPGLGALSLLQMLRQKRNAYSLLIFSINAVTFRSGVAHEVHTRSATWLSSTRS